MKGTMSITASEVYFEVDEDNPDYKKLEPQVRKCYYSNSLFNNIALYITDL